MRVSVYLHASDSLWVPGGNCDAEVEGGLKSERLPWLCVLLQRTVTLQEGIGELLHVISLLHGKLLINSIRFEVTTVSHDFLLNLLYP